MIDKYQKNYNMIYIRRRSIAINDEMDDGPVDENLSRIESGSIQSRA